MTGADARYTGPPAMATWRLLLAPAEVDAGRRRELDELRDRFEAEREACGDALNI
jgi:hypothetical protein